MHLLIHTLTNKQTKNTTKQTKVAQILSTGTSDTCNKHIPWQTTIQTHQRPAAPLTSHTRKDRPT